jgi:AcrR family transcriptional regulator
MTRRADAARNAALLLSAAKELVAERGPEVPLDDVARRAGVGNATLYRHYPTRGDLLVAVYSDEVDALCARGASLLAAASPVEALFEWLDSFVVHVATKRALALAVTNGPQVPGWHESMIAAAEGLVARAREAGGVRPDVSAADLLALVSGAALTSGDVDQALRVVRLLRHGFCVG